MKTLLRVMWPYIVAFLVVTLLASLFGSDITSAILAGWLCAIITFMLLWAARK